MQRIVICYRREDHAAAWRLEQLVRRGVSDVVIDMIADDQPLIDQSDLDTVLEECGLCLALVTPGWASRHDARMRPRLQDPLDAVRLVLEAVARHDSPFLIILDGDAVMPDHEQLPEMLRFVRVRGSVLHLVDDRREIASRVAQILSREEYAAIFRPSYESPTMFYPYAPPGGSPPVPDPSPAACEPASADAVSDLAEDSLRRESEARRRAQVQAALAEARQALSDAEFSSALARLEHARELAPERSDLEALRAELARRAEDAGRASKRLPSEEPTQSVHLAAAAPQRATAGTEFTARLAAYLPGDERAVREELGRLSPRAVAHMGLKACQWQRGTDVSVTLAARGLVVSPPVQRFVWDEGRQIVEFDVAVPADAQPSTVVLKFDVSIESIIVARLRLDLDVVTRADSRPIPLGEANGQAARTAFASYASLDRDRVLDRVAAVRISAGLDIFLDCLALHPGEEWKPKLEAQIAARDLFLLFWSRHAADSPWVMWEWQTALDCKGTEAMQIHPLQVDVPPPDALRHLHFGDVYMLARGHRPDS